MIEIEIEAVAQILAAMQQPEVSVDDLATNDPQAVLGRQCADLFTGAVGALRDLIPNPRVQEIARVVWDLVGHKQVAVVLGPQVPTLSFTVVREHSVLRGRIFVPWAWPAMVKADPFLQLGAVLFVGAQVVDFYNDHLLDDRTGPLRWQGYEAELLLTLQRLVKNWKPTLYQSELLQRFPKGLDTESVKATLYAFKSYTPPKGAA